jgi:predicted porin
MKKIALATLLAATTMVASAQVSISGKVAEFVDSTKTGVVRTTSIAGEPTNNIAISATENLGGGLKARVVVETSIGANTINGNGTQLGDRQSTIGVASKSVSVDIGRNVHSHFLAITNNDTFGTLFGSVAGDVHNLRNLRLGDSVFVNVTPVKNLAVAYERSQTIVGQEATVVAGSTTLLGVGATVARFEQGTEKSTVVGLSTKLFGNKITYTHSDDQGATNSKGDLIGVSRDIGSITAKASYGTTNTDVKAYALGADYNFSKRTALTVAYRNVNKTGSAHDVEQVGVGLTHRF